MGCAALVGVTVSIGLSARKAAVRPGPQKSEIK
jgi:hypothetical protein